MNLTPPAPFWNCWRKIAFGLLLAICCFTRLYDLGEKALMHDETLFVYYTEYQLHREWTYVYQPILHGPLFLYIQALVFQIFGVSDYTMRMGNGLVGIGCFLVISRFRKWMGEAGWWTALVFFTISPGLMFYERFFRNDSLFTMLTLLMTLSAAQWWNTRKPGWAAAFLLFMVSAFCNMETSIIFYFSGFTFFLLMVVHDVAAWFIRGRANSASDGGIPTGEVPRFPPAFLAATVVMGFVILALTNVFEGIRYDGDVVGAINHDWSLRDVRSVPLALGWPGVTIQNPKDAGGLASGLLWRKVFIGGFLLLIAVFAGVRQVVENCWGHREILPRFWHMVTKGKWWIVGGLGAGLALYISAFTIFFAHRLGVFEIYKNTFGYWAGQNDWHRIKGPFHYHLVNTMIYEMPSVIILLTGWAVAAWRIRWSRVTVVGLLLTLPVCLVFHRILFHDINQTVTYFKVLVKAGILLSVLIFAWPRMGRLAFPVAVIGFTIFSLVYFNGPEWSSFYFGVIKNGAGETLFSSGRELMDKKITADSGVHLYLIMFLVFVGTVLAWHALDKGEKFHAWLLWWTITSIGAYCYAREKVPWVAMHMFVPIILLAASYTQKLFSDRVFRRYRPALIGIGALMVLWNTKAALNLSFRNYDSVRERMVYSHSPHDLKTHAELILRYWNAAPIAMEQPMNTNAPQHIREFNNPGKVKTCRVLVKGEAIWPLRWYLRDVDWTEYKEVSVAIADNWEFIVLDASDLTKYPELKEKYYVSRARCRMFWQPMLLDWTRLTDAWKLLIPGHYLDGSPQAGQAYNASAEWDKLWDYLIYRKTFDGAGQTYPAVSSVDYIFCQRKDLGAF